MSSRRLAAALLGTLGLCAAGCGAGRPAPPAGQALFAQACSSCHTLAVGYDPRRQGGSLLAFHASRAQLLQLAGEMPVRRRLSPAQLRAVVSYVAATEARAR